MPWPPGNADEPASTSGSVVDCRQMGQVPLRSSQEEMQSLWNLCPQTSTSTWSCAVSWKDSRHMGQDVCWYWLARAWLRWRSISISFRLHLSYSRWRRAVRSVDTSHNTPKTETIMTAGQREGAKDSPLSTRATSDTHCSAAPAYLPDCMTGFMRSTMAASSLLGMFSFAPRPVAMKSWRSSIAMASRIPLLQAALPTPQESMTPLAKPWVSPPRILSTTTTPIS
mmetsp:Transcript_112760/g.319811  ORF Transcript_112760/g.319811 Transcript_112760/m.319811 type:complete len:225 (-) Transcript_112760:159-833(-)